MYAVGRATWALDLMSLDDTSDDNYDQVGGPGRFQIGD